MTQVLSAEISETRLYTVPEVAEILGLSLLDARTLVRNGLMPVKRIRPNSRPRVSGAAILAYVRNGR